MAFRLLHEFVGSQPNKPSPPIGTQCSSSVSHGRCCVSCVRVLLPQAPSAPAFGGFSWSKPAAEPEQKAAPAPAAAPAKTEASSSDMGSMFSSDMWSTPIKVRALYAACRSWRVSVPACLPARGQL